MLRTDLPDHRRATEEQLVAALGSRDPLALAEAYHRTIPAAHAAARRLLSSSAEVEALLRDVYSELWSSPPTGAALEGWIRSRCFELAAHDLRERDAAPASPSLTALLPELPRSEVRYLDAAERALAELDDQQRRALLLAHDKGLPSDEQDTPDADAALVSALLVLAGPEAGSEQLDPAGCDGIALLGDWVLGLLAPQRAAGVADQVGSRPECAALAKALRRGRRRLEGLPPTPDMGQRVLVVVLAGAPAPVPAPPPVAAPAPTSAGSAAPSGAGLAPRAGAVRMTSALDDTGDLTQQMAPPAAPDDQAPPRRDPSAVYAELAELDEVSDADHPVDLGERDDEQPVHHLDDEEADYGEEPERSRGGRVLLWVLGALFLLAGVIAGLYLGLTLFS